jgi:predicted RNA-binding protein YlqC (UPF0109 family)
MSGTDDANYAEHDEVEYEEGDINTVAGSSGSAGDVDDDGFDHEDGDTGNRVADATSVAVLEYVAKALASEPEAVVVRSEPDRRGVRLRLHVAPEDMGRVIGRRGRTAQAIRTVVGVAGARDGVVASVDIDDD